MSRMPCSLCRSPRLGALLPPYVEKRHCPKHTECIVCLGCMDHILLADYPDMVCPLCDVFDPEEQQGLTPQAKAPAPVLPPPRPPTFLTAASSGPASSSGKKGTVIDGVGTMTEKKASQNLEPSVLDPDRKMGPDLEDPRYLGRGPCGPDHHEYTVGKNGWAVWKTCSRCGLRVEYVPYTHAPCNSTKKCNPKIVESALQWMKEIGLFEEATAVEVTAMIKILEFSKHLPGNKFPMTKDKVLDTIRPRRTREGLDLRTD
jgi:hypothetical protein